MPTVTFPITKQMMAAWNVGSANPGDLHIPLGRWGALNWWGRAALWAPIDFSGMTAINEARLYFVSHEVAFVSHAIGNQEATIYAFRKLSDFSEESHGQSAAVDELWGGNGAWVVTDDIAAVESGDLTNWPGDFGDGQLGIIPITQIVRRWFEGQPNYGLMLMNATSEDDAAYAKEMASRHYGGREPYIWIDYSSNNPPNAPTNLSPTGGQILHTGRTITYSWQHSDPDGGAIAGMHWRLYLAGGGMIDEWYGGANSSIQRTLPAGYNANTTYEWDVRTMDSAGAWGPFCAKQLFRPNSIPNAVSVNAPATNDLTPVLSGGFSDPDPGNALSAIQFLLYRWSGTAWVLHWQSGEKGAAGTTWAYTYDGPALAWGTTYYVQVAIRDSWGAYSLWGPLAVWTTVQPTGPTLTPNTLAAKQDDTTSNLTLDYALAFDNHDIQIYAPGPGALLWTSPVAGDYAAVVNKVIVSPEHTPGQEVWWRARVKVDSTNEWTAWSGFAFFKINANPTAPTVTIETDAGVPAITNPTGAKVTTDSTPLIRAPFSDPDKIPYGDTASARRIEIRRKSDAVALAGYPTEVGTTDTHTITTALTIDVEYEVRVGFRDNAGWPAGTWVWSAWTTIKYSTAPVATLTAPANASILTESTPLLDWAFAASGGKVQTSYRVQVFDKGPTGANYANEQIAWDTGVVSSAETSLTVPQGELVDDHDYRWQVTVTDSDGLSHTLA